MRMTNLSIRWRPNAPPARCRGNPLRIAAVFGTDPGRILENGLARMSLEIQQQGLKRLSGWS
jgi:hypothetical protein